MNTKILLADDHEIFRIGLKNLLEERGGMEIVGEAVSSAEAFKQAKDLKPEVVLMDLQLPEDGGVEGCRRIRQINNDTRVVVLTSYSDEEALFASVMAGASAFLLKRVEAENLCRTVLAVSRGESILDPSISNKVVNRIKEISDGAPSRGLDLLTMREKEVLTLIADGLSNKEIAERICLSDKTVRNYVSSILHKLGFSSRTQAAVYFMERRSPTAKLNTPRQPVRPESR